MEIDNLKFNLSFSNMKNILFEKYDKDFTFIIDGKRYETSRFLADIMSPKVNKFHYEDETINEIIINTKYGKEKDNNNDYFSSFLRLYNFDEHELDDTCRDHYLEYFLQLGNIDEYHRLQLKYFENLTPDNIVDRLNSIFQYKQEVNKSEILDKVISYASTNFDSISKEKLKTLDLSIIEEIVSDSRLRISDEDSLLEFILELYLTDSKYSVLFEYIMFNNLKTSTFEKFINEFNIECMNSTIWRRICQRFLSSDKSFRENSRYIKKKTIIERMHEGNDEFNGLLRYLTEKTGGNIHENRTINITSNSIYNDNECYQPKNLVNYQDDKTDYYHSKSDSDAYVCFDFKDRRIQISSYSIKSHNSGHHLKNWAIDVSNNGNDWITVDEHKNDPALNRASITATFSIKRNNEFYRFVRLRQTGSNWYSEYYYYMQISCIEFYGKLEEQLHDLNKIE